MTWFYVDDHLTMHPKVLAAGNAAMGMWVRAGSYCAAHLTDGFVADEMIPVLGGRRLADRLVDAGLWDIVIEADRVGYQFHQWSGADGGWQMSKEKVLKRRADRARAGAEGGRKSGDTRRRKG